VPAVAASPLICAHAARVINADVVKWGKVVRDSGAKAD
jgi:hypothetical protein